MSLACLDGRTVDAVIAPDESQWPWSFCFSGGTVLVVEGLWRVVGRRRVDVARDDHLQRFGLSEPVDAVRTVLDAIAGSPVTAAAFDEVTGDLSVAFGSGVRLEALTSSLG